jgi:hypothetical protein
MKEHTRPDYPFISPPTSTQPPLIPVKTEESIPSVGRHNSTASSQWNPGVDLSSLDTRTSRGHRLPSDTVIDPTRSWQEQQEYERSQRERRELETVAAVARATKQEQLKLAEEEFYRGEAVPLAARDASFADQRTASLQREEEENEEHPPATPPRPTASSNSNRAGQRAVPEHYSIKQIRWYDARISNIRNSPILIQNANGPCPLLALVNALVLSTPESELTGLVDALRTREQVSLDLLLNAVLEELISGRWHDDSTDLPDVGELYEFLKALHTGMNVNPRFTFVPDRASREIHPAFRPTTAPGEFEMTKEMKLYSAFNIPLVHGWLPERDGTDYQAFYRSAKTYEDAQNIQFHEEELEAKLKTATGLSAKEEELFTDLHTINSFLEAWPTQLTKFGLHTLKDQLAPGSFSILFRNDHFSTVYKEPSANQLLTLVTDVGYASHDEIIWESLVDVNGKGSELFSGDFRPVSHDAATTTGSLDAPAGPRGSSLGQSQVIQSMLDVGDDSEWSTVRNRRRNQQSPQQSGGQSADVSSFGVLANSGANARNQGVSKAEQEDHDLALALQIQEEEQSRARRENAARQRENVFEGQGRVHDARITIPVTGPSAPTPAPPPMAPRPQAQSLRPAVPPRRNPEDDVPPPTYEQAAGRPAFVPPTNHPASPNAPLPNPNAPPAGRASVPPGMGRGGGPSMGFPMGRGRIQQIHGREDRDKCVVM